MPPNAMQVFGRVKLAVQIEQAGAQMHAIELSDYQHGVLTRTDLGDVARRFGYTTTAIHRGKLLRLLASQLDAGRVHFGRNCRSIQPTEDGEVIQFEDGSEVSAEIIHPAAAGKRQFDALFKLTC